jgi:hypothetical protein
MATSNPTDSGCGRCRLNHEEDDALERAVLGLVLEFHPDAFTKEELLREMTKGSGSTEFSEVDSNERAVRDLAAAGLLHPPADEEFVRPTRAALRFFELAGTAG